MKRYFCEKSPNLKWNIGENIGKNFEDFVSDLIKMQLKNLHPQVKVIQTNQVGDGGKDIIVTAETDHLVILGQIFHLMIIKISKYILNVKVQMIRS